MKCPICESDDNVIVSKPYESRLIYKCMSCYTEFYDNGGEVVDTCN